MGCTASREFEGLEVLSYNKVLDGTGCTYSAQTCNEIEIDRTHFSQAKQLLGIGGFGIVRLVEKLSGDDRGEHYGMKSLSKTAVLKRQNGLSSVMTELEALILIKDHPFICNVRYAFQDSTFLYLVLDLATCGDMRLNLRRSKYNRFPEPVAKFFIAQVMVAVEYCHSKNILHRDIKPENILVSHDGYIKLSDFGVAKIVNNVNECYATSGTHGYMPPELYQGDHKHGVAADWFAVGVTLHEFLCGKRPFETYRLQAFRYPHHQDTLSLAYTMTHNYMYLSSVSKHILSSLLHVQAENRLGSDTGLREIQSHLWFHNFQWDALIAHELKTTFQPISIISKSLTPAPNSSDSTPKPMLSNLSTWFGNAFSTMKCSPYSYQYDPNIPIQDQNHTTSSQTLTQLQAQQRESLYSAYLVTNNNNKPINKANSSTHDTISSRTFQSSKWSSPFSSPSKKVTVISPRYSSDMNDSPHSQTSSQQQYQQYQYHQSAFPFHMSSSPSSTLQPVSSWSYYTGGENRSTQGPVPPPPPGYIPSNRSIQHAYKPNTSISYKVKSWLLPLCGKEQHEVMNEEIYEILERHMRSAPPSVYKNQVFRKYKYRTKLHRPHRLHMASSPYSSKTHQLGSLSSSESSSCSTNSLGSLPLYSSKSIPHQEDTYEQHHHHQQQQQRSSFRSDVSTSNTTAAATAAIHMLNYEDDENDNNNNSSDTSIIMDNTRYSPILQANSLLSYTKKNKDVQRNKHTALSDKNQSLVSNHMHIEDVHHDNDQQMMTQSTMYTCKEMHHTQENHQDTTDILHRHHHHNRDHNDDIYINNSHKTDDMSNINSYSNSNSDKSRPSSNMYNISCTPSHSSSSSSSQYLCDMGMIKSDSRISMECHQIDDSLLFPALESSNDNSTNAAIQQSHMYHHNYISNISSAHTLIGGHNLSSVSTVKVDTSIRTPLINNPSDSIVSAETMTGKNSTCSPSNKSEKKSSTLSSLTSWLRSYDIRSPTLDRLRHTVSPVLSESTPTPKIPTSPKSVLAPLDISSDAYMQTDPNYDSEADLAGSHIISNPFKAHSNGTHKHQSNDWNISTPNSTTCSHVYPSTTCTPTHNTYQNDFIEEAFHTSPSDKVITSCQERENEECKLNDNNITAHTQVHIEAHAPELVFTCTFDHKIDNSIMHKSKTIRDDMNEDNENNQMIYRENMGSISEEITIYTDISTATSDSYHDLPSHTPITTATATTSNMTHSIVPKLPIHNIPMVEKSSRRLIPRKNHNTTSSNSEISQAIISHDDTTYLTHHTWNNKPLLVSSTTTSTTTAAINTSNATKKVQIKSPRSPRHIIHTGHNSSTSTNLSAGGHSIYNSTTLKPESKDDDYILYNNIFHQAYPSRKGDSYYVPHDYQGGNNKNKNTTTMNSDGNSNISRVRSSSVDSSSNLVNKYEYNEAKFLKPNEY